RPPLENRTLSGVADLDELLGDLIAGDNVVWIYDDDEMVARFGAAFIAEGLRQCVPCYVVTTSDSPSGVLRRHGPEVIVLDARPGKRFADPALLEQTVIETARTSLGRSAIEGLDDCVRRLGPKRALGLFSRVCPQLF